MKMLQKMIELLNPAVATMITGVLVALVGKLNFSNPKQNARRELQVTKVFEPLVQAIENPNQQLSLVDIRAVFSAHYSIIPEKIKSEYLKILGTPLQPAELENISTLLVAYYNWTKRKIGFPSTVTRADRKLISTREKVSPAPFLFLYSIFSVNLFLSLRSLSSWISGPQMVGEFEMFMSIFGNLLTIAVFFVLWPKSKDE